MRKFKKLAGIAMGAMLAVSAFASGNFAPVTALEGVAEETESVQTYADAQSNELAAYLFVHFVGGEGNENDEQVYFSVSKNGTKWETLNATQPVLKSTVGELGVRDPHIVRSPNGNKFYLIATDLSIYNIHGDWGGSQTNGSKSIVIWESEDLVNWSEPRLRQIARPDATCAWAPESIWDKDKNAYMVFWASKTQDSWTHRVYRCYTTDFDTFTEPEVYIESDVSLIDTTFIEHEGVYYRFTKNEDGTATYVYLEKCTSLSGEFELVSSYTINGKTVYQKEEDIKGFEGPTAYKINGENKWCLLLDNYGKSAGYKPFVTDDITTARFVSADAFDFGGTRFRHGTVIPITLSEYNALLKKWPVEGAAEEGDLVFELNFDNENLTAALGNANVTSSGGTLTYGEGCKDGAEKGKAVKLDGSKFITIKGDVLVTSDKVSPLKNLESCTVSFAVKVERGDTSWWFYAAPNTNAQQGTGYKEKYIGAFTKNGTLTCERYNNNGSRPAPATASYTQSQWMHITLVYRTNATILYIDGEQVGNVGSTVNLKTMLGSTPVIQLGKANWGDGEFADGWLDEFRIHNYALGREEVQSNYKSAMGKA
ncbi:MAG: family 43 glycosylhydrolase [Clostridia bacterium]|nr:family 43 glycosylhydrolase [Clostridia bacterium]